MEVVAPLWAGGASSKLRGLCLCQGMTAFLLGVVNQSSFLPHVGPGTRRGARGLGISLALIGNHEIRTWSSLSCFCHWRLWLSSCSQTCAWGRGSLRRLA